MTSASLLRLQLGLLKAFLRAIWRVGGGAVIHAAPGARNEEEDRAGRGLDLHFGNAEFEFHGDKDVVLAAQCRDGIFTPSEFQYASVALRADKAVGLDARCNSPATSCGSTRTSSAPRRRTTAPRCTTQRSRFAATRTSFSPQFARTAARWPTRAPNFETTETSSSPRRRGAQISSRRGRRPSRGAARLSAGSIRSVVAFAEAQRERRRSSESRCSNYSRRACALPRCVDRACPCPRK